MPAVSSVQESLQTIPIVLPPKKLTRVNNCPGFYEVPRMHINLDADGGLAKQLGATAPNPPAAAAIPCSC